ncbi:MAG: hypothetical protein R3C11_16045, partial [Planctomycetaceae bacterium]
LLVEISIQREQECRLEPALEAEVTRIKTVQSVGGGSKIEDAFINFPPYSSPYDRTKYLTYDL